MFSMFSLGQFFMVYKVLGSIFQFFHWDNFYEDDTNGNDVDDS